MADALRPNVIYKQLHAVIDERTTTTCLLANGQFVPVDEPFDTLIGLLMAPPFHAHCRSIVLPYMKGFSNEAMDAARAEKARRTPKQLQQKQPPAWRQAIDDLVADADPVPPPLTAAERDALERELLSARPTLNAEQQDGIQRWVDNETNVQGWLRFGESDRQGRFVKEMIDQAAAPVPRDLVVYRGVPPEAFPGGVPEAPQVFWDDGFATSSLDREFVESTFGPDGTLGDPENYVMVINVPQGTMATWADGLDLADGGYPELIFPAGSRFRVTSIVDKYVFVEIA